VAVKRTNTIFIARCSVIAGLRRHPNYGSCREAALVAALARRYCAVLMTSSSWVSRCAVGAVLVGLMAATACSSSTAAPSCDSSQCAPGNKCLPLAGETKCRKTCSSNSDPAASCPFGYTCTNESPEPFCVKDTAGLTKAPKGQWGAPCKATGGLDKNPDCDTAQSFWCFGLTPTDGDAYCTRYDCTADTDCGAGFYCATANVFPDVTTAKRSQGDTEKVCLKREYCAPCAADLDCLPIGGRTAHCVADDTGKSFCTPECDKTANCNNEAQCLDFGDYKACYPRAGTCVGDGSLCSPCMADPDCGPDGLCIKGQYTTEKSCAKKSPSACANKDCAAKPGNLPSASTGIGCQSKADDTVPAGYCVGVYSIGGQSADIGCYTPER
jgi:hypothetical protein